MIDISLNALKELELFFQTQEKSPIRLYRVPTELGSRLEFMLDKVTQDDDTISVHGYVFCINKELMQKCGSIHIDVIDDNFVATPAIAFPTRSKSCSASSCSSCASSCKK